MKKRYIVHTPEKKAIQQLASLVKCSPIISKILINRNITTHTDAEQFIKGNLGHLRAPFLIKDMEKAVARIDTALTQKENILIFGDYDADGITATILLYDFLRQLGAHVSFYIPHRIKEGYGLAPQHIHKVAAPKNINLIITVDCGSSGHEAVHAANEKGIDVIITDHHHLPEALPPAVAVVNPKRMDCDAGFEDLAGVGVAYALLICLRKHLREKHFWQSGNEPNLKTLCDLVAIGTVADIVPLQHDNRILVKTGIDVIRKSKKPGINALLRASGLKENAFSADDIAFRLAPRINAAGRIAHAVAAARLLTTENRQKSQRIAACLNRLNAKRQAREQKIFSQILQYIKANPPILQRNALVLHHPDWHEGVLGIVASKLVDRFYRPIVLISVRNGFGKGSARSIQGFHLFDGFEKNSHFLENYGGHAMAAGLRLKAENIDPFRKAFEALVTESTQPEDFIPTIKIDHQILFDDITPRLLSDLELLQPFGEGNPEPLFMAKNVTVVFSKIVGEKHRQLRLRQSGSKSDPTFSAIQFNVDPESPRPSFFDQIAFRLSWNRWNGKKNIQLIITGT
jgi:single-stranded-DNA-specific exonuclease